LSYYLVLVADTVEVTVDICRKELQKGVAVLRALILLTSTLMALQIAEAMGVVTGLAAAYAARTSARLGVWYCILLRCISCMAYVGNARVHDGHVVHSGTALLYVPFPSNTSC
jgi:hypothetical protein